MGKVKVWEFGGAEIPEQTDPKNKETVISAWTWTASSKDSKALTEAFKKYIKEAVGETMLPENFPEDVVWIHFYWETEAYDIANWMGWLSVKIRVAGPPLCLGDYAAWYYDTDNADSHWERIYKDKHGGTDKA